MSHSKNRREQAKMQGTAQRATRQLAAKRHVAVKTNLQVMSEPHTGWAGEKRVSTQRSRLAAQQVIGGAR